MHRTKLSWPLDHNEGCENRSTMHRGPLGSRLVTATQPHDFCDSVRKRLLTKRLSMRFMLTHSNSRVVTKFPYSRLLTKWCIVLLTKKTRLSRDRLCPPFCPHWANSAQHFVNIVAH